MSDVQTKAPTASDIGKPGKLVTSNAAPGVDHAVRMGVRNHQDSPMQVTPIPIPSAHNHELICSGDAPATSAA